MICGIILGAFLNAFDWTKDQVKELWETGTGRVVLISVGCCIIMWSTLFGLQEAGVVSSEPESALVISGDRCWLLYGQETVISSSNRLMFDVEDTELWVDNWDVIEFKGSDWEKAKNTIGRANLDLDSCIKDGKVFDEYEH